MESHTLNKLAEKYWRGECSLEEEQELDELLQGDIPSEFQELAEYRQFMRMEKAANVLGSDFDQEILSKINSTPQKRVIPMWWMKVAAGIALIAGVSFGVNKIMAPVKSAEMIAEEKAQREAELAFEEVKKALMMVSSNMNEGVAHANVLGEFHKAKIELQENTLKLKENNEFN